MGKVICQQHGETVGTLVCECLEDAIYQNKEVEGIAARTLDDLGLSYYHNNVCQRDPACDFSGDGEINEETFRRLVPTCTECFREYLARIQTIES